MKDTTYTPDSPEALLYALTRAEDQLEVAERRAMPGLESFRREYHRLHRLARRGETFRNADTRLA